MEPKVTCPVCGNSQNVIPDLAGKKMFCVNCGREFPVNHEEPPSAPPPPSATTSQPPTHSTSPPFVVQPENRLAGISGWLVLPAIGIVLGLICNPIVILLKVFVEEFLHDTKMYLNDNAVALDLFGSIALVILLGVVACVFFSRKRSAPALIISYLLAGLSLAAFQFLWNSMCLSGYDLEEIFDRESCFIPFLSSIAGFISMIMQCAIWIPYFVVSKRVKATFVK